MSPKSLLRHPHAISELKEFSEAGFQEVIDDSTVKAADVKRVLLCSGKVYYDLAAERTNQKRGDVAIIRVEQLYPFPAETLAKILGRFKNASDIVWVQEEPRNMGAWSYIFNTWMGGYSCFQEQVGRPIRYVGRDLGAAPAVGSAKIHEKEQRALVEAAFGDTQEVKKK
jgi:2-oxoglutarate dehydrogenase E1 component